MKIHLPVCGPGLPIHPRTGLTALGLRRNGAPIWPVRGASPDDPGESGDDDSGDDDGDDDDQGDDKPDDLRDEGKRALDTMKGQRNKARADLRPWAALAREVGVKSPAEMKSLLDGKRSDADAADADKIRRETRAEVERETARERLLDKIEAKAHRFADPADAAALLLREGDADDFLDGSRIDTDAVTEALADLLERKPYLAKAGGKAEKRAPKPDPSQGSRGDTKVSSADRAAKRLERLGIKKAPAAS